MCQTLQDAWRNKDHMNTEQTQWMPVDIGHSQVTHHPYAPFFSKQVGFVLLAGGQGTRLGSDIPKGMVPIPPSGKTLFEIFLRRMVGFHTLYKTWPSCGIMTSSETDTATRSFIEQNKYFGIPKEYVSFFCQSSLPLLDEQGNPFFENGTLVQGPDGNGKVFASFCHQGIAQAWKNKGIQAVSFLNIDNPLMDPLLPALFSPLFDEGKKGSFATILRRSALEKTGVFLLHNHRLHVVEYSEIPDTLRHATTAQGTLLHPWANISVCALPMDTIQQLALCDLPLHFAQKMRGSKSIYKPEYFIFDTFPFVPSFSLVPLDRTRWFSPIKGKTGQDSLEQAAKDFSQLQQEQAQKKGCTYETNQDASFIDPALLYGQ